MPDQTAVRGQTGSPPQTYGQYVTRPSQRDHASDPLDSFRVGNDAGSGDDLRNQRTWDNEALRDYVLAAAANMGLASQADIARTTGVGASMLSRYFSGQHQPSIEAADQLADGLHCPRNDLRRLTGNPLTFEGASLPTPPAQIFHEPWIRDLNDMFAPDSPIEDADLDAIRRVVVAVIAPAQQIMAKQARSA